MTMYGGPMDGGWSVGSTLSPGREASEVAEAILSEHDVLESVLEETLDKHYSGEIKESGRTFCPDAGKVRDPKARYPKAVALRECPNGRVGLLHSHVTPAELLNPQHSIPDMANVFLEGADASVVVGAETSDVLVAPQDRAYAREEFLDAIGVDAEGAGELADALRGGRVADIPQRREAARDSLAPLFSREDTAHPHLESDIHDIAQYGARSPIEEEAGYCGCMTYLDREPTTGRGFAESCRQMPNRFDSCGNLASRTRNEAFEGVNVRHEIVGAALGAIVGTITTRIVFG